MKTHRQEIHPANPEEKVFPPSLTFGAALLLLILFASSTELIPQPQTSELSYSLEMKLLFAALSW